jgi:hypothetical protein
MSISSASEVRTTFVMSVPRVDVKIKSILERLLDSWDISLAVL